MSSPLPTMTSRIRSKKPKVVRTLLYGDVNMSEWELRLLHTPLMQRLYDLKQLGFADRVFPDAIHSRFNHAVGVVEVAERMICQLKRNAENRCLDKPQHVDGGPATTPKDEEITPDRIDSVADTLRLAALLHDVTHIPFGHTLEDEVGVFSSRHDDEDRQLRFFNRLTIEFLLNVNSSISIAAFLSTSLPADGFTSLETAQALHGELVVLESSKDIAVLNGYSGFLQDLRDAFVLLIAMHRPAVEKPQTEEPPAPVSVGDQLFLNAILGDKPFDPRENLWQADLIGNTICADLLDYARRDVHFAGLVASFDDRIYRYLELRRLAGCRRVAIRVFTSKIRLDVLSEILNVLKIRYLLSERVLFHPTKCAAGGMLGRAAVLLGKRDSDQSYADMSDRELLISWRLEAESRTEVFGVLRSAASAGSVRDPIRSVVRHLRQNRRLESWLYGLLSEFDQTHDFPDDLRLLPRQRTLSPRLDDGLSAGLLLRLRRILVRPQVAAVLKPFLDTHADRAAGATRLLTSLLSRQFFKPVYQITRQAAEAHRLTADDVRKLYADPGARTKLEDRLERRLGVPPGTIIVYCPRPKTTLKQARVLVAWSSTEPPCPFNELDLAAFRSFRDESDSIEEKYRDIWSLLVLAPEALLPLAKVIQAAVYDELGIENSRLLETALRDDPRVKRLSEDIDRVESVHFHALVNTLKTIDESQGAAARMGRFPDFVTVYRKELSALLANREDAVS